MSNLPVDNLDLNVVSIDMKRNWFKVLYSHIKTWKEAHLLSIKAMHDKSRDELIFVSPGWNMNLNEKDEAKAEELAARYPGDKFQIFERSDFLS